MCSVSPPKRSPINTVCITINIRGTREKPRKLDSTRNRPIMGLDLFSKNGEENKLNIFYKLIEALSPQRKNRFSSKPSEIWVRKTSRRG